MANPRPDINAAFGRVLRRHRLRHALTQEELGGRAEVDPTYVSQLERGRKSPSLAVLVAVADALDLTLTDLIAEIEGELGSQHA